MFVCLEVDTTDLTTWVKIDDLLAKELGMTHVVWGMNMDSNYIPCKLPSNMFYCKTECMELQLADEVSKLVKTICSSSHRLIVIEATLSSRYNIFLGASKDA